MLSIAKTFTYIFGKSSSEQKEIEVFDFKDKITKESYLSIKDNFKSYAAATKSIRQEAVKNKGQVRHNLRVIKKDVGQYARIEHLALSFIRGRLYSECEPGCKNTIGISYLKDHLKWKLNYKYTTSKQYEKDLNRFFGIEGK